MKSIKADILRDKVVPFEFATAEDARPIMIIGEAPGADEARQGRPFVGASGQLLMRALKHLGLRRDQVTLGNVFSIRPPDNNVDYFFTKAEEDASTLYPKYTGKRIKRTYEADLQRLYECITRTNPRIVLCLGATALWALTGENGIKKFRGTELWGVRTPVKVLATYHPAAVLRNWTLLPTFTADLARAVRQSRYPDIRHRERTVLIPESVDEVVSYLRDIPEGATIAPDIETEPRRLPDCLITCVGIAYKEDEALTIPFQKYVNGNLQHYWNSYRDELLCVHALGEVLQRRDIVKVFQNGIYDIQWLRCVFGIDVQGPIEDTMFIAHALEPELPRDLGYLSSIYLDEPAWKSKMVFKSGKEDS